MPIVHKRKNSSLIWRSICMVWDTFKRGVGKKIGNGRDSSFWLDNWLEMNTPLISLVPGYEGEVDTNEKVVDYTTPLGEWDREKLEVWLHPYVVDCIMSTYPPCEERGDDKYIWKPSTNGCFSIRSAYCFLFAGNHQEEDRFWRILWRSQVPEKVKTFLWLSAHDKAHTAVRRYKIGLADTVECPLRCGEQEDLMHLLRDCPHVRQRWRAIVHPSKWGTFTSLRGADWIKWNLSKEAG